MARLKQTARKSAFSSIKVKEVSKNALYSRISDYASSNGFKDELQAFEALQNTLNFKDTPATSGQPARALVVGQRIDEPVADLEARLLISGTVVYYCGEQRVSQMEMHRGYQLHYPFSLFFPDFTQLKNAVLLYMLRSERVPKAFFRNWPQYFDFTFKDLCPKVASDRRPTANTREGQETVIIDLGDDTSSDDGSGGESSSLSSPPPSPQLFDGPVFELTAETSSPVKEPPARNTLQFTQQLRRELVSANNKIQSLQQRSTTLEKEYSRAANAGRELRKSVRGLVTMHYEHAPDLQQRLLRTFDQDFDPEFRELRDIPELREDVDMVDGDM